MDNIKDDNAFFARLAAEAHEEAMLDDLMTTTEVAAKGRDCNSMAYFLWRLRDHDVSVADVFAATAAEREDADKENAMPFAA